MTEGLRVGLPRRRLLALAALGLAGVRAQAATAVAPAADERLLLAWDDPQGAHWVGLLAGSARGGWQVQAALRVPTRAHGLSVAPDGSVLVVARRPGEWLLRWWPHQKARQPQWQWADADRRFNGHALPSADGRWVYSVESDQDSGQSLLVRRDAARLAVSDEWPTGGVDAHELIWQAPGQLLLANGGVPSLPETGRARRPGQAVDSSLVLMAADSGARLGQWRLSDPELSLRHLSRHANGVVGIALQAQYADPAAHASAPVFARWDGQDLQLHEAAQPLAGYGGSVCATPQGFSVSVPRANGVAHWDLQGQWQGLSPLVEACPLALTAEGLWAGGRERIWQAGGGGRAVQAAPGKIWDNHATRWRSA